jgi:TRAP-type C4-dicarboxylate transport system permease small subunit
VQLLRRVCVVLGCLALAGLVVLPSLQIVLRGLFDAPVVGLEEVTRYLLIVLTFAGIPLVTAEGGQIRMDELVRSLPPRAERAVRVLIAAVSGAALALVLVAVYSSIQYTLGSSTPTVGIPFWLFNLPALLGAGAGAGEFLRQAWRAATGRDAARPARLA